MIVKSMLTNLVALNFLLSGWFVWADDSGIYVSYARGSSAGRQPVKTAFPKYPVIARRDRIEGAVTVCFRLDKQGKVRRARIKSYTHKIFKAPALRAIRNSTFESLQPDQKITRSEACRTYRFNLNQIETTTTDD